MKPIHSLYQHNHVSSLFISLSHVLLLSHSCSHILFLFLSFFLSHTLYHLSLSLYHLSLSLSLSLSLILLGFSTPTLHSHGSLQL